MLIIAKSARQWLIELYQRQGIQFFHSPQKYYHKRQPGRDRPTLPQWGWWSRTITSWKLRFRTRTAQTTAEPFILVLFLVLWQFVRKQVDRRWWAVADDTANGKWENGKQRPLMPLCKTPAHREHLTAVGLMAKKVNVHEATYVAREVNNGQLNVHVCLYFPIIESSVVWPEKGN